jgi:hypothetical protein
VIRAKLFLEGYKDRHATDALIKAAAALKPDESEKRKSNSSSDE